MIQSISLIRAIVLLHEKEREKKPIQTNGRKINRLMATQKNLSLAKQLAHKVLGRNLSPMPSKTTILFLLIEKMGEIQCVKRKSDYSAFRFIFEGVRLYTGWSYVQLKLHLNRLEAMHYLRSHRDQKNQVVQYELIQCSKSVTTILKIHPSSE